MYRTPAAATLAPNILINPVVTGLKPLLHNEVVKSLAALPPETKAARWAVFEELVIPDLFKVAGLNVINGTRYTPDFAVYGFFDPDGAFKTVYNRFAHVIVQRGQAGEAPHFNLLQPDLYELRVDPCSREVAAAGVRYMVFPSDQNLSAAACLKQTGPRLKNLVVYQRVD